MVVESSPGSSVVVVSVVLNEVSGVVVSLVLLVVLLGGVPGVVVPLGCLPDEVVSLWPVEVSVVVVPLVSVVVVLFEVVLGDVAPLEEVPEVVFLLDWLLV